ncbi:hypothetical protein JOB18_019304 [Solea senegalensis]|uniref:Uncharacterized protein n=1 Tax=Solea senegalensis TaxID=28829 RepID=A0AAV6R442_SOLSE|nr:hypothetical protein JOB18_019304 [Solea senegalensis]
MCLKSSSQSRLHRVVFTETHRSMMGSESSCCCFYCCVKLNTTNCPCRHRNHVSQTTSSEVLNHDWTTITDPDNHREMMTMMTEVKKKTLDEARFSPRVRSDTRVTPAAYLRCRRRQMVFDEKAATISATGCKTEDEEGNGEDQK